MLNDRSILVTGGAGSVGRELVRRFLWDDPEVVRVFDNSESSLSEVERELDDDRCRYLLGDIRERGRLERAMDDIDFVVHAAAMKHVDISEYNPFEAVKSNVLGVQNVVDTAIDTGVQRVVFTSSDKAVTPTNTMGVTKLLGEKLTTAANKYSGRQDIKLASVRFGNVINSSESVVPLFKKQIEDGGPVTLTDPRMTRFFLTNDDLAALVETTIEKTAGGEIFIFKMPAIRIEDLASVMIDELAPRYGYEPEDVSIEVTNRRVGETYHEAIMNGREANRARENNDLYAIPPERADGDDHLEYEGIDGFAPASDIVMSSDRADPLAREDIVSLLERGGALEVAR